MQKFKKIFGKVLDPRAANAHHDLMDILFIALAAVLCGAQGPADMQSFASPRKRCCGASCG